MTEHADKIPQNIKDQINGDITALNEAISMEDGEKIREALDRLKNSSMEIGKSIYSNTNSEDNQNEEPQQEEEKKEDGEEKKDEEKK